MTEAKARTIDIFFYGLFMDEARLREQGVNPMNRRRATLENFRLVLGARATLAPCGNAKVHGVVFALTHSEIDELYSGASVKIYRPEAVSVLLEDQNTIPALCYNLTSLPSPAERNPRYLTQLRNLAEQIGLPADYVASIQ